MHPLEAAGLRQAEALEDLARGLVGLPKPDAVEICADLGLQVRMTDWDLSKGPFALYDNYVHNRVTVYVKSGVVTRTQAG